MEDYATQFETQYAPKEEKLQGSSNEPAKKEAVEPNSSTQNLSSATYAQPTLITKFCINCGSKIDKNASMCPNCGVVQSKMSEERKTKFCTNCGSEIDVKAEICPKCGVRQSMGFSIPGEKNPAIAALLSVFIVGLGEVYAGKPKRGIVLFIACIVFAITSFLVIPFFGILACWLGSIYDSYKLAQGEPGIFSFIDHYTNEI